MGMLKDVDQQKALAGTLTLCRRLAVSYTGLLLTLDMFPQARLGEAAAAPMASWLTSWRCASLLACTPGLPPLQS